MTSSSFLMRNSLLFLKLLRFSKFPQRSFLAQQCSYSSDLHSLKAIKKLPAVAMLTHTQENLYCHKIIENKPNYSVFNLTSPEKIILDGGDLTGFKKVYCFDDISPSELVRAFKAHSLEALTQSNLPLSDGTHEDLRSAICDKCSEFTDEELGEVILYASIWPMSESSQQKDFFKFWRALDKVCIERWKDWSVKKILYFIDLWYTLKLIKFSDFVYNSLAHIIKRNNKLTTPENVIQVLFYLNALRSAHKGIAMYNLEHKLQSCIHKLSLAEVGIAALGFFKTKKRLQSEELLLHIMAKVRKEVKTLPEITLTSIYKCLRLSLPVTMWRHVESYLDLVTPELDRLSLSAGVNIALLAGHSQTVHPTSCTVVSQKLVDSIATARIKDMERTLFLLSAVNFDPPTSAPVCDVILEEIRNPKRHQESETFGRSFISLVNYLILKGHYPYDLISQVLDMNFILRVYGKNKFNFGTALLFIDCAVELACPDYKGNRLPSELRNYMSKVHSNYTPDESYKMSKHNQFTHDVMTNLKSLLGPECLKYVYILPHYVQADIVYQTDKTGKPVPLPQEFVCRENFKGFVHPLPNGNIWHCAVVGSKNMFCHNTLEINGNTVFKLKSLSKLGYEPHVVSTHSWPHNESIEKKKSHLKKLLII